MGAVFPPDQTHHEATLASLGTALGSTERLIGKVGFEAAAETILGRHAERPPWIHSELTHKQAVMSLFIVGIRQAQKKSPTPFSVQADSDDANVQGLARRFMEMGAKALIGNTLVQTRHMCWYERAGKRIYEVSPGLAERLRHTELKGLVTDDLRLPHEAIYLVVPSSAELSVKSPITGIYMCEDKEHRLGRVWHVMACGPDSAGVDFRSHFFRIMLPPKATLDEALAATKADMASAVSLIGFHANDEWEGMFRWAMNAVIYATWSDAEKLDVMLNRDAERLHDRIQKLPANSQKRDRLREELRGMDPRKRIILGRSIRPEPAHTGGSGKELDVRVRVQGHWKKQAHGEGFSLRKTIWIQPYWKGPEDGVMGSAVHRLV